MRSFHTAKLRGMPLVLLVIALVMASGCDAESATGDGADASIDGASRSDASVDGGAHDALDAALRSDGGAPLDTGPAIDAGPRPWPDETNTGVPEGVALTEGGSLTVTTDGEVIE